MTIERIAGIMRRSAALALLVLVATSTAAAQEIATESAMDLDCANGLNPATLTSTERNVLERISGDGIHVVHFWSPRYERSISALRKGWLELIESNGDATFTFVTVWNDGETGEEVLKDYIILDRVEVFVLPDRGPSSVEKNRRTSFLSLPLTRTPSTWIFHQNGRLAFAMNYGALGLKELQALIDILRTGEGETTP